MKRLMLVSSTLVLVLVGLRLYRIVQTNDDSDASRRNIQTVFNSNKKFKNTTLYYREPSSYEVKTKNKVINENILNKAFNVDENIKNYNAYRQGSEDLSRELVKKYSTNFEVKKLGPYSLVRLDRLSLYSGGSKNVISVAKFYNNSIIENESNSEPYIYIDTSKSKFVLVTGIVIVKSEEKKLNIPYGSKVISNVEETGIYHIKLAKETDPFDGLEKIRALNSKLIWANLEFVDRMEAPQ